VNFNLRLYIVQAESEATIRIAPVLSSQCRWQTSHYVAGFTIEPVFVNQYNGLREILLDGDLV
jgi:hypothetical protein